MKIGLLLCDHVRPEFRDEFGDYPAMFSDFLPELEMETFAVCDNKFPDSANACDAYIATGSSYSVYENIDWIIRLKEFVQEIRAANKAYVGICFGHQMLGEALGGKVQKSENGWGVGVHTFQILEQKSFMNPFQPSVNLLMMCQDQVVEFPPNSKVIAKSAICPVGMFLVGDRMLGIQAHPEFPKAYNQTLMENRISRMGAVTVEKGIKSLDMPLDASLISQWIMGFLSAHQL